MALQYGFNITESDWKKYLEQNERQQNGIRTWRQLFGNASLGYNAQSDALRTDYASAIAEAYKSNFAQRNAILGAGLSAGSTQQLLSQSQADLHAAYDTYIRNYGSAASALAESYGEEVGAIEKDLTERAANFANLYNSAYKYLSEELYGSTFTDINKNTSDYMTANNLGYALNGTALKSWSELSPLLADSKGNLTAQGVEFFDQMFNAEPQGYIRTDEDGNKISVRTFDQWLSDTNPELRDWWVGQDMFNYTRAGTNVGSTKVGAGMESDDQKYHSSEYLQENKLSFVNYDKAFSQKRSDYKSKYDKLIKEAKEYDSRGTNVGDSLGSKNREEANKITKKALGEFSSMLSSVKSENDAYYKELLGSELFSTFIAETSTLTDEYNQYLAEIKDLQNFDKESEAILNRFIEGDITFDQYTKLQSKYSGENIYKKLEEYDKKITDWTKRYNEAIKQFNKKHGYTGKTSGF